LKASKIQTKASLKSHEARILLGVQDLDLENNRINVRAAKGGKRKGR
jgi:hypothetical protein